MFFSKNNIFIGISPLNWTNDDMPNLGSTNTFEQILSEASLTGYSGVEIGVTFPQDINTLIYHTKLLDILPMPKGRGFLDTNDTCLLK